MKCHRRYQCGASEDTEELSEKMYFMALFSPCKEVLVQINWLHKYQVVSNFVMFGQKWTKMVPWTKLPKKWPSKRVMVKVTNIFV